MPGGAVAARACVRRRARASCRFCTTQPPADPKQMTCLDLHFMKSITGNKNSKQLVFHGNIHAAHAAAQVVGDDAGRSGSQSAS